MRRYRFRAVHADGRVVHGVRQAANDAALAQRLARTLCPACKVRDESLTRDGIDACPVCARLAEAAWREAKASGEGGQARDAETRRAAA